MYHRTLSRNWLSLLKFLHIDCQMAKVIPNSYDLEGGISKYLIAEITLGEERFIAPEILFQPSLIGQESQGISSLLVNAINKTDENIQPEMWQNIFLSGGTSMLPGLPRRLKKVTVTHVSPFSII